MASQDDDYFNDLSQQPLPGDASQFQSGCDNASPNEDDSNHVPRPKRIACIVCRKRKLRCDGKKPSCGTCARLGHSCAYDEVRKKSGPKRGYVKQLEARLAQVETLLKTQEPEPAWNQLDQQPSQLQDAFTNSRPVDSLPNLADLSSLANLDTNPMPSFGEDFGQPQSTLAGLHTADVGMEGDFSSWEVISLGLEEPLPTQDVMAELNEIFFKTVYPSIPMIHRPRYYAAMDLAPNMRPPVCLRYSMWTLAASITPEYSFLQEHFYARARKYIQMDEMKGHGESIVSVAHCQAWTLISLYEFKQMFFPRAWISCGRAARLAAMMSLNRLDGVGLDVKQTIPPPRDWTEREERRRTFWMAFTEDRYASIGTGWPMIFDERDILTNLPSTEDAFVMGKPEAMSTLQDVLAGDIAKLSPLGSVVLMACMFGRNLIHLHRPDPQDQDNDLNGEFWKRHRTYDNILLNISLSLPSSLRLPHGISDPNIIFTNMSIHTSTICLHQAAIFKAEKNRMRNQIAAESKRRCIIAADQVASIMKMASHTDLSVLNPFSAFCLYVAARVFVQYLKSRPDDQTVKSSLQFLLTALNALKAYSTLTESFMMQLDIDLAGTEFIRPDVADMASRRKFEMQSDTVECSPIFTIRESQGSGNTGGTPQKGSNSVNATDSPYSQGGSGCSHSFGSLPSRQKNTGSTNPSSRQGSVGQYQQAQNASSSGPSPRADETATWTNFDMDFSTDISASDNQPSASDNASPATMNSSTNNGLTPPNADRLFPSFQSKSNFNSVKVGRDAHAGPMNTDVNNFPGDMSFSQFPDSVGDPTGTENPFLMGGSWAQQMQQSSQVGAESNDAMATAEPLSNAQVEQMLQGMSWASWNH